MKAQSEYIGFIFALIIILILLIPLMFYLIDVSAPSAKPIDYQTVANLQINGGSVLVYYNSSNNPKYNFIIVYRPNANFTLDAVYYIYKGEIVNITKDVYAVNQLKQKIGKLPQPLVYNFTIPTSVYTYPLILQITAYNTTTFALLQPNETAVAP